MRSVNLQQIKKSESKANRKNVKQIPLAKRGLFSLLDKNVQTSRLGPGVFS